jgi:hypothetical protein
MENALSTESKINNKDWLKRGQWDSLEAACVFAQIDIQEYRAINFSGRLCLNHPKAQKYYEIIDTWYVGILKLNYVSPWIYIDKALEEDLFDGNIPQALVVEIKRYLENRLPHDRDMLFEKYSYIKRHFSSSNEEALPHEGQETRIQNEPNEEKQDVKVSSTSGGGEKHVKREKPLTRKKLEEFVKHLIDNSVYETFSKFEHAMTSEFLYSGGAKPEDHETYDEHPGIKRVYAVLSSKSPDGKNKKYKVHFSTINAAGAYVARDTYALSSFKAIFDSVRAGLNK